MGRDESVYTDANEFRPERWLPTEAPGDSERVRGLKEGLKKGFHPFSMGAFDCAGRSVAMLELLLVCAWRVWRVDVRVKKWDEYAVKDACLCLNNGSVLQFRGRIDSRAY